MARSRRGRWESFKKIVKLWVDLFDQHELLTSATAIALQALVAAVALALLGIALLGEFGAEGFWNNEIAPQIEPKVLPEVFGGIDASVQKVFVSSSGVLIAVAVLLSIWEVSGVVRACMSALSKVYGTKDERPFWIRFPISFGIAVVLILALGGSTVLTLGLRHTVHGSWGLPFAVLRWVATIVLLSTAFGVLVRFAPAERRSKKWASGGATLVVVLWILQSLIFAWYVRSAANYKTAEGSLTFVYLFTTYFYVAGIVLLVGIELDELLRRDLQGEDERGILDLAMGVIAIRR